MRALTKTRDPTRKSRGAAQWSRRVEDVCASKGLQLTPLRRRVLSILSDGGAPIGAYAIMEKLSKIEAKPIAPPTVYRTLDFFVENGFVHKIESRNAFALCEHVGQAHNGVLLLCKRCGHSEEIQDSAVEESLRNIADRVGFSIALQILEVQGLCNECVSLAARDDK